MSEFHFESQDNEPIIFTQEEVLKLAQELRTIINEVGIDEFCKRIEKVLDINIKRYKSGKGSKYIR